MHILLFIYPCQTDFCMFVCNILSIINDKYLLSTDNYNQYPASIILHIWCSIKHKVTIHNSERNDSLEEKKTLEEVWMFKYNLKLFF